MSASPQPTPSASPLPDAITAILNDPNSPIHLDELPPGHVAIVDEAAAVAAVRDYMNATGPLAYVAHGMRRGPPHESVPVWLVIVGAGDMAPYPVGPAPLPGQQQAWAVSEYAVAMVSDETGEISALETTMREVPPPSAAPTEATQFAISDAFWDSFINQPPDIMRDYEYESLADMTRNTDLIVRGRLTDVYVAEIWKGAPDDPGNPFVYGRIAIDEVLSGQPASRQPGSVEVQLFDTSFGWQPPDPETVPNEETLFFLNFEPKRRQENGAAPRDTDVAPFAYFIPAPESIIRNIDGRARLIEPTGMADAYGEDYYPLDFEGSDFEALVEEIRGIGSDPAAPFPTSTPGVIDFGTAPISGPLSPRYHASSVWTGEELLIWGGTTKNLSFQETTFDGGAAYDPVRDKWRAISKAPLSSRGRAAAAWTGHEMLVWGGSDHGSGFLLDGEEAGFTDGAAYDPATDTWRTIEDSPFGWVNNAASVWTGTDLVIAVTRRVGDAESLEFMAYDPVSDSWRLLPPVQAGVETETELAWTGRDLIVRNLGTGIFRLDGMSGEWMSMPDTPGRVGINSNLIWTGDELLAMTTEALGGEDYRHLLIGWTPERDAWRVVSEPPGPIPDSTMIAANGHLLLLEPGLSYDIAAGRWSKFDPPEAEARDGAVAAWMTNSLAIWGGGQGDSSPTLATGGLIVTPDW